MPVHIMMTYRRSEGKAPPLLNLRRRWRKRTRTNQISPYSRVFIPKLTDHSRNQEIPYTLRTPKVYHRLYTNPPLVPNLNQTNQVYTPSSYLLRVYSSYKPKQMRNVRDPDVTGICYKHDSLQSSAHKSWHMSVDMLQAATSVKRQTSTKNSTVSSESFGISSSIIMIPSAAP